MKKYLFLFAFIGFYSSNNLQSQTITLSNALGCDILVTVHNGGNDPACHSFPICDCCKDVICVPAGTTPTVYALSCAMPKWCTVQVVDPCPSGSNCTDLSMISTSWYSCFGLPASATLTGTTCAIPCAQANITVTWTTGTTVVVF